MSIKSKCVCSTDYFTALSFGVPQPIASNSLNWHYGEKKIAAPSKIARGRSAVNTSTDGQGLAGLRRVTRAPCCLPPLSLSFCMFARIYVFARVQLQISPAGRATRAADVRRGFSASVTSHSPLTPSQPRALAAWSNAPFPTIVHARMERLSFDGPTAR